MPAYSIREGRNIAVPGRFPGDFHEPFYKNYISRPIEAVMSQADAFDLRIEIGIFSNVVTGRKRSNTKK